VYTLFVDIDWLEVGKGVALLLAGAGGAVGVIRKWFTDTKPLTSAGSQPKEDFDRLLPAVLEALETAKDACDEATSMVRAVSLTAIESQRSLGSLIGALREIVDRIAAIEIRLRRQTPRKDRTLGPGT